MKQAERILERYRVTDKLEILFYPAGLGLALKHKEEGESSVLLPLSFNEMERLGRAIALALAGFELELAAA
jgi:hypothetical protein